MATPRDIRRLAFQALYLLDARTDSYLATLPSLQLKDVSIDGKLVSDNERMLTGGFYAEVDLTYDAVIDVANPALKLYALVYDTDVEALHEGYTIRLGLRNTLQTQRGGEGRWRDVDWLTIDTDMIFRSDDATVTAPIARYFSYRPEYSPGGDHFYSRVMWAVSDALAAAGEVTWDFENEQLAQWRAGVTYQFSPALSWFADYSRVDAIPSSLFSWGFTYEITVKYQLAFRHIIDMEENQMRGIEAVLVRKLPRWRLAVFFAVDDIDDDKTVGVVLIPDGVKSSRLDRPFSGWLY